MPQPQVSYYGLDVSFPRGGASLDGSANTLKCLVRRAPSAWHPKPCRGALPRDLS